MFRNPLNVAEIQSWINQSVINWWFPFKDKTISSPNSSRLNLFQSDPCQQKIEFQCQSNFPLQIKIQHNHKIKFHTKLCDENRIWESLTASQDKKWEGQLVFVPSVRFFLTPEYRYSGVRKKRLCARWSRSSVCLSSDQLFKKHFKVLTRHGLEFKALSMFVWLLGSLSLE